MDIVLAEVEMRFVESAWEKSQKNSSWVMGRKEER
jgi:hypothetical protein